MRIGVSTGAALLAISAPAGAQLSGEHFVAPADSTFRLGDASSRVSAMQEFVPAGETVERWTRIITVMRLPYRVGVTPAALLRSWLGGLARVCGVPASEPVVGTVAGRGSADARFDCPRNPSTGKPETVLTRIVVGDEGFHWVQAATRRGADPTDLAWASAVIAGTSLCKDGSTDKRCATSQDPTVGSPL